jgi:CubicO group peptidase (beta-lactamase class C family)
MFTAHTRQLAICVLIFCAAGACGSEGLLGPPPATQPPQGGRVGDGTLDKQLELIRGNHRLPALAVATFGPDAILEDGFAGVRALGYPEPIASDDQWHVGSLTKSMTATVAAMLVEEGTIGWDTVLPESFPDLSMQPQYLTVRLRDLLTNSSGMTSDATSAPSWASLSASTLSLPQQRRELAREFLNIRPVSAVGTYNYSNAGYIVAGAMLEAATGRAWEDLIAERLFQPLGMTSAGFGPPRGVTPLAQPWGHAIVDDGFGPTPPGPNADNPPAMGPAGTVHASLADLVAYYQVHLAGAMGRYRLLSAESFAVLHTPASGTDYACGWGAVERTWAGGTALSHAGSNNFWFADVWLAPAKGFGVLVVTNGAGLRSSEAVHDAAVMLITRFTGEPPA